MNGSARLAYAAPHLVLREDYRQHPGAPEETLAHVDWDATLALRRRLDRLGFGIAEAMDTAQRFAIGWPVARRLIEETGRLGPRLPFIAGAGSDQAPRLTSRVQLVDAVLEQIRLIQGAGGIPIVLPMAWLPRHGASAAEYQDTYGAILRGSQGPLLLHWLGEMFAPELRGYFPGDSFARILALDPERWRGAKLSLLDSALELRLRRELCARGQILFTGDDLHFASLLLGEGAASAQTRLGSLPVPLGDFSHALLGVLDAIAEPAARALACLAQGDTAGYSSLMAPCEELGRWLFQPPVQHYKAGLAFLSWLNGLQDNMMLVHREERSRELPYYRGAAERALRAGALADTPLCRARLQALPEQLR